MTEKCPKCNLPADGVYFHITTYSNHETKYRKQFMHGEHSHTVIVTEDEYKKENPRQVLHREK